MTVPLTSARKVRAITSVERIRELLAEEIRTVHWFGRIRAEATFLAGLCYDSPNEHLSAILVEGTLDLTDETKARNAAEALHHELTVGVS